MNSFPHLSLFFVMIQQILINTRTDAFSGISAVTRAQDFLTSGTLLKANRKINGVIPGSELFPEAGSSYIPSGLSAKEWEDIKRKEQKQMKNKDLGAWGPRFAKSEVPTGDWMVTPNLWTRGFSTQPNVSSNKQAKTSEIETIPKSKSVWNKVKNPVLFYAFSCFLLECIFAVADPVQKKKTWTKLVMAMVVAKPLQLSFERFQSRLRLFTSKKHVISSPFRILLSFFRALSMKLSRNP